MESACGLSFSLSLRERGGVRASATQALQVSLHHRIFILFKLIIPEA
jgi:hypothetical protein